MADPQHRYAFPGAASYVVGAAEQHRAGPRARDRAGALDPLRRVARHCAVAGDAPPDAKPGALAAARDELAALRVALAAAESMIGDVCDHCGLDRPEGLASSGAPASGGDDAEFRSRAESAEAKANELRGDLDARDKRIAKLESELKSARSEGQGRGFFSRGHHAEQAEEAGGDDNPDDGGDDDDGSGGASRRSRRRSGR